MGDHVGLLGWPAVAIFVDSLAATFGNSGVFFVSSLGCTFGDHVGLLGGSLLPFPAAAAAESAFGDWFAGFGGCGLAGAAVLCTTILFVVDPINVRFTLFTIESLDEF